jgi:hypothetical protein
MKCLSGTVIFRYGLTIKVARYEDILEVKFTPTRREIKNYSLSLDCRIKGEEIILLPFIPMHSTG